MKSRLHWVDFAKGLGIILVVYGHVLRGLNSANLCNGLFFKVSDNLIYGFHMPLFFFLSGIFTEKWVLKDFKNAFSDKLKFLVYPYFVWSLLQGSFNVLLSKYTNNAITWGTLLNIFYQPIGQFWFLYALFFVFFIYYLLRKKFNLIQIFMFSLGFYFISPFTRVQILGNIFKNFLFFVFGILYVTKLDYKIVISKLSEIRPLIITSCLFILANIFYLSVYSVLGPIKLKLVQIPIALIGILFVLSISSHLEKLKSFNFFKYLGMLSVVIYVAHILITASTRIFLMKFLHISNLYIHIAVGTTVGVILPVVFYALIKKFQMVHVLFGKNIEKA
ncbi:MAG: acyltransferase [bacterium]